MKKIIYTLIALLTFSTTSFASFPDVDSETYYQAEILWMQSNNIISGYEDGNFGPDNCVTRAEFLKMLYETMEVDVLGADVSLVTFSDINSNQWFTHYVATAVKRGSVNGYPDDTFKPNNCVNRAEAMKVAIIEYRGEDVGEEGEYALPYDIAQDLNHSDAWYWKYVSNALSSYSVGTDHFNRFEVDYNNDGNIDDGEAFMNPRYNVELGGNMSRKEVAAMLYKLQSTKDSNTTYFYQSKPNCREGYELYRSAYMPFEMCIAKEFGNIIEEPTGVDQSCYNGQNSHIKNANRDLFISIQTNDFELTCDHGAEPISENIMDCFTPEKSTDELKACFPNMTVYEAKKIKMLNESTAYYFDIEYFGFDVLTRTKKYFIPLENHQITIDARNENDLEILNTVLTLESKL